MKKLFVLILIAAAGYGAYKYFIDNEVLDIKADIVVSTNNSVDIEAPALMPSHSAFINGTVHNLGSKAISNIILKYKLDGKDVEAAVYKLDPNEKTSFSTQTVSVRNTSPAFYLIESKYEK